MKKIAAYLTILWAVIILAGCSAVKKSTGKTGSGSDMMLVSELAAEPSVSELTAGVRYEASGRTFTGQLRMRRGRCIQLSAGLLGIEAFRVELFPDHVMIMDRTSRRYVECHYADLPHRNTLALDYSMIEAIFWNRVFSPECDTPDKVVSALRPGRRNSDGSVEISDIEWGHMFRADAAGHLVSFAKSGTGWRFWVEYGKFSEVSDGYDFPMQMDFGLTMSGGPASGMNVKISLSDVSAGHGSWKDETRPTARMKPAGIDDIIELLEEIGL